MTTHYTTLHVALPHSPYDILIGESLLDRFAAMLPPSLSKSRKFFICDSNTELYARRIAGESPVFSVSAGEQSKSFSVFQDVLSWLLDHQVDRHSLIVAVGGGVVGDLAGFAAASVMRGVPVVQVPTSLLAMVDSSVGGKTGINMPQGKNLVGAFHQPSMVICDLEVLKTLPERELKAGYAEILKYALLGDSAFFDWLETHGQEVLDLNPEAVSYAVKRSCEMKRDIVVADEKETSGRRALLNLGHTFAHAFEAVMGYDGRLLHGEAVAVGMVCAMELSVRKNLMSAQQVERVVQHLSRLGLKAHLKDLRLPADVQAETLLEIMRGDKKAAEGSINFILMRGIGQAFLTGDVAKDDVIQVLTQ
ncbi:MAG: 3-dehydroquinate synthase [Rhodospirillales bacterium]|nr:3-dehydroquinate synthase [Rhodospirillales bacterium]MCB9964971.1 3-dehydroquinate synthase [Rhodospirillales bacterium]